MSKDRFAAYFAAMQAHGRRSIGVELDVVALVQIVGALQLALRHPNFPVGTRASIERFVRETIDVLHRISPAIADVMEAGNDPGQDVERSP